jgi:hypothetical protein
MQPNSSVPSCRSHAHRLQYVRMSLTSIDTTVATQTMANVRVLSTNVTMVISLLQASSCVRRAMAQITAVQKACK